MARAIFDAKDGKNKMLNLIRAQRNAGAENISAQNYYETQMEVGDGQSIKIRVYNAEPERPKTALIYLHGGGWTIGSAQTCAKVSSDFAKYFTVIVPEYRLAPEHLPVCAILHTLLALAAALLFLYNLFYLSLQLYLSSPAPARYSQPPSNTAFFSKLTHSLDSPAARGRLCLLLLWISCVFCLDSWILSGIINSAMEICLTLSAGVLFWLFFPSLRLASNHPHSLL